MTNSPNTTNLSDATMEAELYALPGGFDWIVEDWNDPARILADTHAEYRGAIEANRADDAGDLDPARVTYEWGTDGESLFVHTDLRTDARRAMQAQRRAA
ncbi:MAG: hypothetical protein JWQ89_2201 [Devosia sp.]|uniref:hypothetical protein n=1 Tax=Devosia sp. TaxID=1871048 RepID=UPI0026259DBE|nr:hypothetical protein [Devosia sp.]MDB5540474.1 hypothetical protein [Devosia sp.]